jgi:DNA-binding IclR family transcriptional regulator
MLGYQAPAVQKAFLLLNTVAEAREGMRLTEISKGLGFSKGTTHGLIQALLKVGALYQSPFQKKELNMVRRNGYAADDGEYIAGVKSIAMSLNKFRNLPLLMWVVGFSSVMPEEKTPEIVQQMAVIRKKVKLILN